MQDQLDVMKEIISSFLLDSKEGKKKLKEWFLNTVMEEARIQERFKKEIIENNRWKTGT